MPPRAPRRSHADRRYAYDSERVWARSETETGGCRRPTWRRPSRLRLTATSPCPTATSDPDMPFAYYCRKHGKRDTPDRCPDCERERSRQPNRRTRGTARWQNVRALARARDGGCVICRTTIDLEVHHITALSDGGAPYDPANLATLCANCHRKQTAAGPGERPIF